MGATARVMIINYVVAENMHVLLMRERNCLIQNGASYHFFLFSPLLHGVLCTSPFGEQQQQYHIHRALCAVFCATTTQWAIK